MRKKNYKGRCEKRVLGKCDGVCKTYDPIQRTFADILQSDINIIKFQCNVPLDGLEIGEYTSDFVCSLENGDSLVGMLTQLINNSGISICMVGTPESTLFFEQAMPLARRSLGVQYGNMNYNSYFYNFCDALFSRQYVQQHSKMSDTIAEWLYQHSAGIPSIVVSLIHDAQEIAILSGSESLNLESLTAAYQQRITLLHGYIEPSIKKKPQTASVKHVSYIPS